MADLQSSPATADTQSPLELFLLRLRYKEGRLSSLEGNNPLLIGDPASVWVVYAGKVDIFSIRTEGEETKTPRRHVMRVEAGQLFFGMDLAAHGEGMGLLATGVLGTRILRLQRSGLQKLAEELEFADLIGSMLELWVDRVSGSLATSIVPIGAKLLDIDQASELADSDIATPREGVLWIKLRDGSAVLADRTDLPPLRAGECVPLSQSTWLRSTGHSVVESVDTRMHLVGDDAWDALAHFHALALCAIRLNLEHDQAAERDRRQKRQLFERVMVADTFAGIASVLEPVGRPESALVATTESDALLAASELVAGALAIKLPPALHAAGTSKHQLTVAEIARAARVRVRQIELKNRWWRQDNGPILGRLRANDRPVALLPKSPTSYVLHDIVQETAIPVTAEIAAQVSPAGFTLYRPLPTRAVDAWELVKFGAFGCKRDLWKVLLLGLAAGLLGLIIPIATQVIFDTVVPNKDRGQLLAICLFLVAVAVATALFQVTRSFSVLRVEGKMGASLQAAVWDRLLSLPASFFRRYSAGDLGQRAMGINSIRELVSGPVATTILSATFSLFNVVLLFYYDALLAVVALALIAVAVAVAVLAGVVQVRYQREVVYRAGRIWGLVLQIINGIAKIRVIAGEDRAFVRWAEQFAIQRKTAYKARSVQANLLVFNAAFPIVASLTIFATLAATKGGSLTPGRFVAFNTAFAIVLINTLQVSSAVAAILSVVPIYERIKPILHSLPEVDESKTLPGELEGAIEASHVSFRYAEGGPLILSDVSMHVKPGEFVALVGPSGSGKSTLLRLLLGLERPESGALYYDSQDLSGLDVREVRRQIGTVIQNGKVMTGNLLENIVGSSLLTIDDAWEAARMAGIEDDIKQMPMGMFTLVSEEGGTFSGGQRQRLMIARAIVKKPRIVFFDEATSALDNSSQELVSESLEALHATRVVIAHRLSTIMNADRIYVMQNGRVVQHGTYEELMQQPGLFSQLAKRQIV